jgi:uncharacterized protein
MSTSKPALSMYQASVPGLIRLLDSLSAILDKAAAFAATKKIDETVLTSARLAPDMYALAKQVQLASDAAKGCGARLAGVDVPSYADTETTFPELKDRIGKTIAFLKTLDAKAFDGSEGKPITLKLGGQETTFSGFDYLFYFVLPHFHFHVTTAYDILRHNGLELTKKDYLGKL